MAPPGDVDAILETGGVAALEVAASALASRGAAGRICANCGQPLIGAYCAFCGQPRDTHRRTVRGLLHDFFVDVVNFDSRVLRTARALLFQPGELPAAFREGRTQPYVPAIRLYLFVTLIFFVLLSATGIAILQFSIDAQPIKVIWDEHGNAFVPNPAYDKDDDDPVTRKLIKPLIPIDRKEATRPGGYYNYSGGIHFFNRIGTVHTALPEAARKHLTDRNVVSVGGSKPEEDSFKKAISTTLNKLVADPAALNGPLTSWLPRALFLLLPLYAVLLALFHLRRRKEFYFVDHLVFSLSVHTFTFVLLMLAAGLAQIVDGTVVAWAVFAALSAYIFVAMKQFYAQGWAMTAVKFTLVSGIYTVFFLLPAMLAVLLLSIFGDPLG